MKKTVAVLLGLALMLAVGAFAKTASTKSKAAATQQASGKISTVDDSKLVLSHKVKGKEEQTTYVLNADTKKQGTPMVGAKATVHYKVENGENVATVLRVSAMPKK
jgi:hypothetical protein